MSSKSGGMDPRIVAGLRSRGFSATHSRGIAAGVQAESRSDPNVRGGYKGRALGIGQWLGPRRAAIIARYGENPTLDQQLDHLALELRGGDAGGKHVLAASNEADTLDAYITKFMRPAEGPETTNDIRRGRAALGLPPREAVYSASRLGTTPDTAATVSVPTFDEAWGHTPEELFRTTEDVLRAAKLKPKAPNPTERELVKASLTGGDGSTPTPLDLSANRPDDARVAQAKADHAEAEGTTSWGHFKAAYSENLVVKMIEAIGRDSEEFDPVFMQTYNRDWQSIEAFAQSDDEVAHLREATSASHLAHIQSSIMEDRDREKIIQSSSSPTLLRIGVGLLDPVGWAAGAGVGKALQLGGISVRAMAAAGRPVAALGVAAAEGAAGNLAFTAGLDATGEYVSPDEYKMSALSGLVIGAGMGGLTVRSTAKDEVLENVTAQLDAERVMVAERKAAAQAQLGPDASPEAIDARAQDSFLNEYKRDLEYALADVPDHDKLMVADDVLTDAPDVLSAVEVKYDLAAMSDPTDRALVAEGLARAEGIVANHPVKEEALQTILAKFDQEATSTRLLLSKSPAARAFALTVLENPQGAGGRRKTAAIMMQQRQRIYNQQLSGWDRLHDIFVRQEGISKVSNNWNGKGTAAFDRRVLLEVERRGGNALEAMPDKSPIVNEAADLWTKAHDVMRLDQQHVRTVGSENLHDTSVGYVSHRLDPRKLEALSGDHTAMRGLRSVLAGQFETRLGMDAKFAETLSAKYVGYALKKAKGGYQVPANLHTQEAGDIVRELLEEMKLPPEEFDRVMGKYARGGAQHTKKRLQLDLSADIGGGKQLIDIFVTDMPALFRTYSRRTAGEVALTQYGIMGKKGLLIYRDTLTASGATPHEMKAFDQAAAEMLNTPFGEHNHEWMDTISHLVSASRLGGMGYNQAGETGNAIAALGVRAVTNAISDMPRTIKEARILGNGGKVPESFLSTIDTLGGQHGVEGYHMTRAFDVPDNQVRLYGGESMGVMSRFARAASHNVRVLSGHRMVMAGQVRGLSEQIGRKAVRLAKSGENDTALRDMGFNDDLMAALRADLHLIADFDAAGEVIGDLRLRDGKALKPHMVAELVQSVERGASQIIQGTYVGETGAWAHDGFLKFLFKFRTFTLTSVEKQWGRNASNYGAQKAFVNLMVAASFAVPIHLARVAVASQAKAPGKEREDYLDNNTNHLAIGRATLNYASAGGFLGDILDVGVSFASNYGGDFGESLGEAYGVKPGGIAPAYGWVTDLANGVLKGDPKKIVKALPGSNLPYVTPFLNWGLRQVQEDPAAKVSTN